MDLYLDNIGKICDSTIIVDGLTVITGENNSGKTTVGKTLYSIISSVENLQQNAFIDKRNFAKKTIRQALNRIELRRSPKLGLFEVDNSVNLTNIDSIFDVNIFKQIESIEGILSVIDEKIKKLNNCSEKDLHEFFEEEIQIRNKTIEKRFVENFMKKRTEVIELLDEVKKSIKADFELTEYANAKIIKTLKLEFYEQIKGVNNESKKSKIRLSHGNEDYYNIELLDNELLSKDETFFLQAFDSSLFVDDVFVVDEMADRVARHFDFTDIFDSLNEEGVSYEDFLNKLPRKRHKEKLLDKLMRNNNLFEENLYKARTEEIIKCMKDANPGQMAFVKDKYVIEELDVHNLAMGSKMFCIIKTLIEKGHCGSRTLLVLDEPEIHLHPEWQNILAETIVLLVKHLETKVILTTHSPNFLLAIDVFTKIHKMRKLTHFYKSISIDKGKAKLEIADENINEIYEKMTKPFVELEARIDTNEENDLGE
jgi:predicted ATPase